MRLAIVASALLAGSAIAQSPAILLWPNGAPGSEGKTGDEVVRISEGGDHVVSNVHRPSITPYFSPKEGAAKEKSARVAVIVIPGGGHRELGMDHEGYNVYAMTGQGFGIRAANGPPSSEWPNQFLQWLAVEGFLKN